MVIQQIPGNYLHTFQNIFPHASITLESTFINLENSNVEKSVNQINIVHSTEISFGIIKCWRKMLQAAFSFLSWILILFQII